MMKLIKYIINRVYPIKIARPMTKFMMKEHKHNLVGLEIGVHRGEHSYNMLRLLPIKELHLIDPYIPNKIDSNHYKKAKRTIKRWNKKAKFVMMKSEFASRYFVDVDFVYIDGDHSYEGVKKDIEIYYDKVKKGGIIGGHDFCGSCPGVCRAVIEFVDKNKLTLYSWDKDWWIRI